MNGATGQRLSMLGLVLLLALSGCGGGSGSSTEESTETVRYLTKDQLSQRLGDMCQAHTDRQVVAREKWQKKNGLPSAEGASRAQLEKELVVVILPIVRDTIHDVGTLHAGKLYPSPQQKKKLEKFRRALEHGVKASEKDPSWVVTNAFEPFYKARERASELGTVFCGQA
jgi:hypothetical protein